MKTACVLIRGAAENVQIQFGSAFADGLRCHGVEVTVSRALMAADLLVMWGVRRRSEMSIQLARRQQVCILERGYLGNRMKWTSVSFGGGLNGRGEFRGVRDDASRFDQNFSGLMQPWQQRSEKVALLVGQVPGDMSLVNMDMPRWYSKVTQELLAAGYRVLFREHPRAVDRNKRITVPGTTLVTGSLAQSLAEVSLCVTYNSNTAVEAVLAGVPTITMDIGSMAWEVTSHDVASGPIMPERQSWAAQLAWKQWTEEELRSGACWEAISRIEPNSLGRRVGQGPRLGQKGQKLPRYPNPFSLPMPDNFGELP